MAGRVSGGLEPSSSPFTELSARDLAAWMAPVDYSPAQQPCCDYEEALHPGRPTADYS